MEISLWIALGAGLLSFFSPCIFPVLPAYLSHLTGGNVQDQKFQVKSSQVKSSLLIQRSIAFVIGFSLVFMMMGASATFLGQLFQANKKIIEHVSGIFYCRFWLANAWCI